MPGYQPLPTQIKVDPYNRKTHLRFVATAAVDILGQKLGYTTRAEIAKKAFTPGMKPSNLSAQLGSEDGPTAEFLSRLERQYLCRGLLLHHGAPWLTSFHEELHQAAEGREVGDESVRIPIGWFHNLARNRPRNSTEAFVQGHALSAFLSDARRATQESDVTVDDLVGRFKLNDKVSSTVTNLLEVVAGPPHTALPAVRLVASFGELALPEVKRFIFEEPAGFRAVRVLGRILVCHDPDDTALLAKVEPLLQSVHADEPPDPYPARSLVVEALRYAPDDWTWVLAALLARTQRNDRPVRERVYAAFVHFERATRLNDEKQLQEAFQVMELLKESSDEGLSYAGAFLHVQYKRAEGKSTPYAWPHGRPESSIVDGATKVLEDDQGVPYAVRNALRSMVQGALLTIDGTARRSICEAIQAAGLTASAVVGLKSVIEDEQSPSWLVEHAAFIAGYLQTGHRTGSDMTTAVLASLAQDRDQATPVRHAALWGIGDIVGSLDNLERLGTDWYAGESQPSNEPGAEKLLALFVDAATGSDEPPEVRRAGAYLGAMLIRRCTFDPAGTPHTVVSPVFERLSADSDSLVAGFARWGAETEAVREENSYLSGTGPRTR